MPACSSLPSRICDALTFAYSCLTAICRSSVCYVALLISFFCCFPLSALEVDYIERSELGELSVLVRPELDDSYFIIIKSSDLDELNTPFQLMFPDATGDVLSLPAELDEGESVFYKLIEVSGSTPRDVDGDGIDDIFELLNSSILDPLSPADADEDIDNDGLSNFEEYQAGTDLENYSEITQIQRISPADGETGVAITRETIIEFTGALREDIDVETGLVFAQIGNVDIPKRVHLSPDRRKLTIFYHQRLPGSASVRVMINGSAMKNDYDIAFDVDGDGKPGGVEVVEFDTLGVTPLQNTIVCGRVFASKLTEAENGQPGVMVNEPLAGVIITADGAEDEVRAVTDAEGNFRIENAPPGDFFVHIDGREIEDLSSGIRFPDMSYYPFVGKSWTSLPGQEVNIGEIYLPLIAEASLTEVSEVETTFVEFPEAVLASNPELAGTVVEIPANSLFSVDGERGGSVGIAPVDPARLPGALPDDLEFPLVITVQTDGGEFFDEPVPVCFPNLDGLPAGSETALWSFNHQTGQFEVVGPMTISADGTMACTDPGVGILAPGWHGVNPGTNAEGGEPYKKEDEKPKCPNIGTPPDEKDEELVCIPPVEDKPKKQSTTAVGCTNPVFLFSGEKYEQVVDLRIPGVGIDFVWSRTYGSKTGPNTPQGNGWDFTYNRLIYAEGSSMRYCNGSWRDDVYRPKPGEPGKFSSLGFFQNLEEEEEGRFKIVKSNQKVYRFCPFDGSPMEGKLESMSDRNGNTMTFHYDSNGRLERINDTLSRDILIAYNDDGFVESVTDFAGRQVRYEYYGSNEFGGNFGDLKSVTTPVVAGTPNGNDFLDGKTTTYTYSEGKRNERLNGNLLSITDGRRNDPNDSTFGDGPYLINEYAETTDPSDLEFDRVIRQTRDDGIVDIHYMRVEPSPENGGAQLRVIENDHVGHVREYFFDVGNRLVLKREYTGTADAASVTTDTSNRPTGKLRADDPDYFETRTEYNSDYLPTRTIYPNGNVIENVYAADLDPTLDARFRGNILQRIQSPGTHLPAGDQESLVETFEYDSDFGCSSCGFNFVTRHVDARGNETLAEFDDAGNLLKRTHRISSIIEEFKYDDRGRMIERTLPDNGSGHRRVDQFTYYEEGPQNGYRASDIIDSENFALTTLYEYDAVGNVVRLTDPRGNATDFVVNSLNQVVREIGREVELRGEASARYQKDYFYDANNNLVRSDIQNIDHNGVLQDNTHFTTTYTYDMLDYLLLKREEVEAERDVITEYQYDAKRNRVLTRYGESVNGNQPDNQVAYIYDERDLLYQSVRAPGHASQSTTQFDYDGNGNQVGQTHGLEEGGHLSQMTYDGFDRLVSSIDSMGNESNRTYDENSNLVKVVTLGELDDVAGSADNIRLSETAIVYDVMDRQIQSEVAFFTTETGEAIADGVVTSSKTYSDTSQILTETNDNGNTHSRSYDTVNRLAKATDPKSNTVEYSYDANSNVVRTVETEKSDLGAVDEVFETQYVFDSLNRQVGTIDNLGNRNEQFYDSRSNRTLTSDANRSTDTDDGNLVSYAYDGLNRLLRTEVILTADGWGGSAEIDRIVTDQLWDDSSRLVSQIDDNGNATIYTYDPLNRKTLTTFADETEEACVYDSYDNRIFCLDANGNEVTRSYDLNDRIVRVDIELGAGVSDDTTFEIFAYDGLNRITHAEDDDSVVTRQYDSLSNITLETQNGVNVASTYDGVGNKLTCTYPDGRIITTSYDALERKATIQDEEQSIAVYSYFGPARVERKVLGNGTQTNMEYDEIRRMTEIAHRQPDDTMFSGYSYIYDRLGNRLYERDLVLDTADAYNYDSNYRLTDVVYDASGASIDPVPNNATAPLNLALIEGLSQTWQLDGVGNWLERSDGSESTAFVANKMNEYDLVDGAMQVHDENGNLTNDGNRDYIYNYRNQLIRINETSDSLVGKYGYDVFGRRIRKEISGSVFVNYFYDGEHCVEERDDFEVLLRQYVFGGFVDEALELKDGSGNYYYHANSVGSVASLSGEEGKLVESYAYDAYGTTEVFDAAHLNIGSSSSIGNTFGYTGRRLDRRSSLYYYRARYFSTENGRFLQRDPLEYIDGMGLYEYVSDNPVNIVDPFGYAGVKDPGLGLFLEQFYNLQSVYRNSGNLSDLIDRQFDFANSDISNNFEYWNGNHQYTVELRHYGGKVFSLGTLNAKMLAGFEYFGKLHVKRHLIPMFENEFYSKYKKALCTSSCMNGETSHRLQMGVWNEVVNTHEQFLKNVRPAIDMTLTNSKGFNWFHRKFAEDAVKVQARYARRQGRLRALKKISKEGCI
ncbi:DUF6531 domain-containing protein [Puniceicoccaceae bacterium K14]|nr:DUF6531 domain-containing protein [Puniceicoccaceae bacterium K14]